MTPPNLALCNAMYFTFLPSGVHTVRAACGLSGSAAVSVNGYVVVSHGYLCPCNLTVNLRALTLKIQNC